MILGELLIFIAIAIIFNVNTKNSLYGTICVYILFGTLSWFLLKIVKDHKNELSNIKIPLFELPILWMIYLAVLVIIISAISTSLTVLFQGFS